ncbi:4-hydroxybutyrate CoA-transferase [Sphingobium sp. 22B]|uniref:acetyl-CoA hydrolase/transferase family protein n=1 Tax=unclassified Sphingobium TaxID=2611147 RepID=UPI00078406B9|nr:MULTISPECIES: acetyl-CoA hydrolase/transferase C-terminal domain-containing protein [unclassified Sphingobium]KXU29312.1 4-hydroxybutyrate CoA-transferase [Sphingobium sp. AM]KYC32940.1 4-hydroxybutyrate CoA-transferase [Sphingobium sp. 22B]OAP29281.1 4-hydroxybutyrate CoA-transferase [Sphingobium sp. 20006FA]
MTRDTDAYRSKLMSPEQAAASIPHGARICMGLGVAQPPAILQALARRGEIGDIEGASLYYLLSTAIAGTSVLRRELGERLRPMSLFHSAVERALDKEASALGGRPVDLIPVAFSRVPQMLRDDIGVDTLVTQVAPPDEDGNFSLGTNVDYAHAAARCCTRVIVEVNRHMPRTGGASVIPLSAVTAIVEHDQPLPEIMPVSRRPEDDAIGAIIAGLVDDGACLQMGIGAVPEAVCAALKGHRHLGIHTELLTPGLAGLMASGVVDNSRKAVHPGKTIFTFAMGDRRFYEFLDGNPDLEGHPVDHVNDAAIIARNPRAVSVNATLEVDLQGACNSEVVNGRQYSAAGGQLDFVRGAGASPGGKSIIACHATAAGGTVSRIVPRLNGPVTTPRNDVHIIVTEFGWADLRGKSLAERGKALIGIAHPRFRDELAAQLDRRM